MEKTGVAMKSDVELKERIKEIVSKQGSLNQKQKEKLEEVLIKYFTEGGTLASHMGFDKASLEHLFRQAELYYNSGKYNEADKIFRLLMLWNGADLRYFIGVAACAQMNKDYKEAIIWYLAAVLVDPKSPYPWFYMSGCYEKLDEIPLTIDSLENAVQKSGNNPVYKELKEKAMSLLEGFRAILKNR